MPAQTATVYTRQGLAQCLDIARPSANFHWSQRERKSKKETSWLFIFSSVMVHYAGKEGKAATGSSEIIYRLLTGKFIMPQVSLNLAALQVYLFPHSCFLMASQACNTGPALTLPAFIRYSGVLLGRRPGVGEEMTPFSPGDAAFPAPNPVFHLKGNSLLPPKNAFNYSCRQGCKLGGRFIGRFGVLCSSSADQERGTPSLFIQESQGNTCPHLLNYYIENVVHQFSSTGLSWVPFRPSLGYLAGKLHRKKKLSEVMKDEDKEGQERSSPKIQPAREVKAKNKTVFKLYGGQVALRRSLGSSPNKQLVCSRKQQERSRQLKYPAVFTNCDLRMNKTKIREKRKHSGLKRKEWAWLSQLL